MVPWSRNLSKLQRALRNPRPSAADPWRCGLILGCLLKGCVVKTLKDYSCLLQKLQEVRKPVIVTGILPRLWTTSEWYSRAMGMNSRVGKICAEMGLNFCRCMGQILWEQ